MTKRIALGVTGTDTGVGKTVVSRALIHALRARGLDTAAMKPVETGSTDDASALHVATGHRDSQELVCPVTLAEPAAPLIAARVQGMQVPMDRLDAAFLALQSGSEAIVVEGAGGLLVPITETETYASLFARWNLGLVIVAANRLGVINHTLLTLQAARSANLRIRGIVLNEVAPPTRTPTLAERTNADLLAELGGVPVWRFPYLGNGGETTSPEELTRRGSELLASELLAKIL